MLEALLYQSHDGQKILGAYTQAYFLNDIFANQSLFLLMRNLGTNIIFKQEFAYATHCQTAELAQQWRDFLVTLEDCGKSPDVTYTRDVTIFKTMLVDFNKLHCLPLWFATEFYQAMRTQSLSAMSASDKLVFARTLLKTFAEAYTPTVNNFLHQLKNYKEIISKISTQRGATFTRLAVAQQLWQQIYTDLIVPMTGNSFAQDFQQSPLVIKIVACDVMSACIDLLDSTIKTLKTSNTISWPERIDQFKIMLNDFNTVMRSWLRTIMPEQALAYHGNWPLNYYLNRMQDLYNQIMQDSNSQQMFQRASTFSVNAAMLGAGTAFERHYPSTAEDMFMLIHQNALVAVAGTYASLFNQKPLDEILFIPQELKDITTYIESSSCHNVLTEQGAGIPQRIGIRYTPNSIELLYNMSLRNHSSTFQIIYNQTTQQCTVAVQFLGEARNRWEQVALLAAISPDLSNLPLVDDVTLDTTAGIVSWNWAIHQKDMPSVIDYLGRMAQLSFGNDLYIEALINLYNGPATISSRTAVRNALNKYQTNYGRSDTVYYLLQQL